MRSWLPWFPNMCSIGIIVLMTGLYIYPSGDLDYGMLIRLGEHILQTGDLRPTEAFSYTIHGREIPDHEWLFELMIWSIWTGFGFGGLKLLKVILVGSTLFLVGLRLRSEGVRWHGIFLSLILAVFVLGSGWNLRPLYFTTIGLILVSWWLHDHCLEKNQLSWWLPVVMWVWANMHPGVITGQALILGAISWEWLNRTIKLNSPLDVPGCRRLSLVGGTAVLATFLSPDPIGRLLCPFQSQVRHPVMRIFTEMSPLHQAVQQEPGTLFLVYLLAGLVLISILFRFRHYRLWEIALLIGVFGLASMAIRSVQDCLLIMLSVGVPQLAALLREWAQGGRRRWWVARMLKIDCTCKRLLISPLFRFQWCWPALALLILAIISLVPALGREMPICERTVEYPALSLRNLDPLPAVQWMKNNQPQGGSPWKIFAPPDYGSYLIWKLGPDRVRCYVDTRGFIYEPELIADGQYIPQMGEKWRERLERVLNQGTDFLFLEVERGWARSELWAWLEKQGARPIYLDEQSVLVSAEEVRRCLRQTANNPLPITGNSSSPNK